MMETILLKKRKQYDFEPKNQNVLCTDKFIIFVRINILLWTQS